MTRPSLRCAVVPAICALALALPLAAQEPSAPASTGAGANTFQEYCRSCHGPAAKGDGPVGKYLSPKPADLTLIAARSRGEFPFDDVYQAIATGKPIKGHGSSEMPIWGSAFREVSGGQTEEQVKERIEQLVQYLKSIQVEAKPKE